MTDAGLSLILTQRALSEHLPLPPATDLLLLDELELSDEPVSPPTAPVTAENLAYMIYTSGSTGRPKGVMITHSGVTNYLRWAKSSYCDGVPQDGAVVHSPLSFDLTVTSLLLPLLCGECVKLLPETGTFDELNEAIKRGERFSLIKLTPSHADTLAQLFEPELAAQAARVLVLGGEALAPATLNAWQRLAPQTRFVNEYGPTEAAVGCCVREFSAAQGAVERVPIGRPIANTQLYVLDHSLEPAPLGVPGELCIAGAGLARGYFAAPALSAQKFIPNPFGPPGSRLYRTGDLARFLPNGELEYLGRLDQQIKLRGLRIELGEIEACFRTDARLQDAAVLLNHHGGDPQLVAFVVPSPTATNVDQQQLRERLQQQLPGYMVPATIIIVAQLPLSTNGKLDRKQLLALAAQQPLRTRDYLAPRTEVEEILAAIWSNVLQLEQVSIDDNFFELGGHSLLAMRLLSKLRDDFQVEVSLAAFLRDPTIANLSSLLITYEPSLGHTEKVARIIKRVRHMSPLEIEHVLARRNGARRHS